jgi:WD40 repeat protein
VRLYEYSEGAFVQIAIGGGVTNGASPNSTGFQSLPNISFPYDSEFITIRTSLTNAVARVYSFTGGLIYKDFQNVGGGSTTAGRGISTFDQTRNVEIFRSDNGASQNNQAHLLSSGFFADTPAASPPGVGSEYMRCFELSPDSDYLIEGRINPQQSIYYRRTGVSGSHPVYNAAFLMDTDKNITVAAWSVDSRFALVGDGINGGIEIHEVNTGDSTLVKSHELPIPVDGVPVSACFSPDQRMLAVGFDNLGTLNTVTYRRSGSFYIQFNVLPGMGSLLDFSADGSLLIDAQKRKCFRFDGAFTELTGAMTNIVTGGAAQATSTHAVNPLAFGQLYNGVVAKIVDEQIDYSNVKLALLSEFASFDPTHSTLAEVNGAGVYSVSTGMYPVDGELITGITPTDEGAIYAIKADAITRTIIDTNLEFKYAVAYDATNDTPLAWFDYVQNRTIPKNTEVTFTFRDGNLITFAR